jgi:protease IV
MTDSLGPSFPPSAPPTAPFSPPPAGKGGRASGLFLAGCGLFMLLAIVGVVAMVMAGRKRVSVDDQTVVRLNLGGIINERVAEDPVSDFFGRRELTVFDYRALLKKAAADKRVKGVVLRLEPLAIGWAKVEELRDALVEYKKSGKWLYVYAEFLTEKEYALALPADEIIMPPDAPFEFNGIASEVMHYPGLLEKLGVEVQYFRFGKYKSVSGESFGRKALTEPVKEMINENLDRVFSHFAASVSQFRQLDEAQVKALVDEQGLKSTWALEKKLIDRLAYWDEVETLVKDKVKAEVTYVNAAKYAQVSPSSAGLSEGKHSIGLVYSQGLIVAGRGSGDDQHQGSAKGCRRRRHQGHRVSG